MQTTYHPRLPPIFSIQCPFAYSEQLATWLGKDLKYLRSKRLADIVRDGQLGLLYKESPNLPHQADTVPKNNKEAGCG